MSSSIASFITAHLPEVKKLRHHIHAHPELAHQEIQTANALIEFFSKLKNPPEIVSGIGGTGFLAIFNFEEPDGADEYQNAKTIVFRSELDAVPVVEKNEFSHVSKNCGVSHKCGHDGHMAILAGLGLVLSDHYRPQSGRVVLLFQPAEETGEGAQRMVDDSNHVLADIVNSPNSKIFALHNVPGFPTGTVVLPRRASFASASRGLHVKLGGACCHASQPHMGKNPALAMCNIVTGLLAMPTLYVPYDQKALVTIVGARVGEKAFGVSAGEAEVMATLRATTDTTLSILVEKAEGLANGIAATYGLTSSIHYEDPFAATINNLDCVALVQDVAVEQGLPIHFMDEAFPWSEDFGIFLQRMKGAMFGLGMGERHEPLHGEFYDFPDNEIVVGVNMFASVLVKLLEGESA